MSVRIDPTPVGEASLGAALEAGRGRRALRPAAALLEATVALGAAAPRRELLTQAALIVTTGQQPGLLGGPLYALYKGLAAGALAERLERELGQPVVPVFWVAGDDHDFHEASRATILTMENELLELVLRERPHDAPQHPVAREPVGPEIRAVLAQLAATTPETEFKAEVLATLERCYRPDVTLADAFASWMAILLAESGVVVFRAYAPGPKAAMAPLLVEALRRRVHRLATPGPVVSPPEATTVMIEGRLGRDRLVEEHGAYHARRSGERWTLAELVALAEREPERLSPNVLLRPVAEAYLWAPVAYVAGPAELEYLPQSGPLYEALGVVQQPAVPRFGARLVEARVLKVLERLSVPPEALSEPPGPLEARLIRDELPQGLGAALEELRRALETGYPRLAEAVGAVDPTLRRPAESAMGSALSELGDVEKRAVAHLKRKNETLVRQIAKARVNLYPRGKAQERVLSWPMYAIRYGDSLLASLREAARAWAAALPLEGPPAGP